MPEALLVEHGLHDIKNQLLARRALLRPGAGGHLEGGVGQIPAVLLRLPAVGDHHRSLLGPILDSLVAGAPDHRRPAAFVGVKDFGGTALQIGPRDSRIADEVQHPLEDGQPHILAELIRLTALIALPPLPARLGGQRGHREPLQNLHAGIVRLKIGLEGPDPELLYGGAGVQEGLIVRGQADAVFLQQLPVHEDAVHLRAGGQPVHGAVAVRIAAQVGLGEGVGQLGVAEIQQGVPPVRHVPQGKAPDRQDIRQIPVSLLEAVEIRGVGGHIEAEVHLREGLPQIGPIALGQLVAPESDCDRLPPAVRLRARGRSLPAAGQQREARQKRGKPCLSSHREILSPP